MTEQRIRQPGAGDQVKTIIGSVTTYASGEEPEPEYELVEPQSADQYMAELEKRSKVLPRKGARESLLIRTFDRAPVRVYLGEDLGYRDLELGMIFVQDEDPAYDAIQRWAEHNLNVEIVGVKAGSLVCAVCGEHIEGGEDGLALHTFEFHVDSGEAEETGRPPSSAARARAEQRRRERVEKRIKES